MIFAWGRDVQRWGKAVHTLLLSGKGKLQNTTHSVISLCNDFYMVDFLDIKKPTGFIAFIEKQFSKITTKCATH